MTAFDVAAKAAAELSEDFARNEQAYLGSDYTEARLRLDFIDKLFVILGWDVTHEKEKNPYKQEVRVEKSVLVSAKRKRCDYAFFLTPDFRHERFLVEAKKPSSPFSPDDYFQTIRYAWWRGAPISILTSFNRIEWLDCRVQPDIKTASNQVLDQLEYPDLQNAEAFAKLYWLFSREAVSSGSIQTYADGLPRAKKRGKESEPNRHPDLSFLNRLDEYRATLASAFKKANSSLGSEELTEATQRTLDRLIFIRFLEDKLIETAPIVASFGKDDAWNKFVQASKKLNVRYNGIVFKPHLIDESRFEDPGEQFGEICAELSDPHSPYDFDAIEIDIIGSVYERFLGKRVEATATSARVVETIETRKQGGVYYTPQYVVDHIVSKTVGKVIADKNPADIEKMRFIDLSCGSGSFLLGVFKTLINYHSAYYQRYPKQAEASDLVDLDGRKALSLRKKQSILLNNIFGVDLDPQAVEVTQLSLYLRLLEDETTSSAEQAHFEFKEALLPSLGRNIVCANGIVGTDVGDLPAEDRRRIRPVDLRAQFQDKKRGDRFDVVLGNPPWGADIPETLAKYLASRNERVLTRMPDTYLYFVNESLRHLKPGGFLGMILPSTLLTQSDMRALRSVLLGQTNLREIVNLGQKVFGEKVLNTSCILVAHAAVESSSALVVDDFRHVPPARKAMELADAQTMKRADWVRLVNSDPDLTFYTRDFGLVRVLQDLQLKHPRLDSVLEGEIQRGVTPDVLDMVCLSDAEVREKKIEKEALKPLVLGAQVGRYLQVKRGMWLAYLTRDDSIDEFPNLKAHMDRFRRQVTCPEVRDRKHPWYSLHRPRSREIFERPKFIGLTTSRRIEIVHDSEGTLFATDALYVFSLRGSSGFAPDVVLAILQSRVFEKMYLASIQGEQRVIPQIKASKLGLLPFPRQPPDDKTTARLSRLVKERIELSAQMGAERVESQRDYLSNSARSIEQHIEDVVSDLYGLTSAQRKVIDESQVVAE